MYAGRLAVAAFAALSALLPAPAGPIAEDRELETLLPARKGEETQSDIHAAVAESTDFLPNPVATVGEHTVSANAVRAYLTMRLSRKMGPEELRRLPTRLFEHMAYQATQRLVNKHLVAEKARLAGFVPATQAAEQRVGEVRARLGEQGLARFLQSTGLTLDELRENVAEEIGIRKWMQQEVGRGIAIPEEQVMAYYREHQEAFRMPARRRVFRILVAAPAEATDDQRAKAAKKARKLRERLENGADFGELAREESDCPSAEKGGDLGYFARGQMDPNLERVAFRLDRGDVSKVVETPAGFHILRAGQSVAPATVSFEDAKSTIVEGLRKERLQRTLAQVVTQLREQTTITVHLRPPGNAEETPDADPTGTEE